MADQADYNDVWLPWYVRWSPVVLRSWYVSVKAENQYLHRLLSEERRAKERVSLLLIEAQNPGIDIERVRAERGW